MSRESSAANCASSRVPSTSARWSAARSRDRKSTRLNSSHSQISYAVFCLKKKNQKFPPIEVAPLPQHHHEFHAVNVDIVLHAIPPCVHFIPHYAVLLREPAPSPQHKPRPS